MSNFKTQQVDIKTSTAISTYVLPAVGHILPFAGPSDKIPSGWVLCDGTNGTPDLRGKIPGGKSNISPGSSEEHSHSHVLTEGTYGAGYVTPTATINSASVGGNNANHTHGMGGSVYAVAWGDSGPANRSNGTQANVIGRTHTHGGTTSAGASGLSCGTQSDNHSHSFNSYGLSNVGGNYHSHSTNITASISSSSIIHNSLPSIFYVNFIMKV